METPQRKHIIALLVVLVICIAASRSVNADDTNGLKLDGTLVSQTHAPDGSWIKAGEKVHISAVNTNDNTVTINYKGTNMAIPKYGLTQQSLAFFLQYHNPNAVPRDEVQDTNTTAPIIESGRQIALLTNTAGTLNQNIYITTMTKWIRHPDYTMDGDIADHLQIGPRDGTQQIKILKVEDDMATVVPTGKTLTFPAITIPVCLVNELKGLPHLSDKDLNWYSSAKIMAEMEPTRQNYLKHSKTDEKGLNANGWINGFDNTPLIPWHHSEIVDEYQKLKVPLTTEAPTGDNSSIVAVANALNYLYTKNSGSPTQVSKSFLTWAHDTYHLNDDELSKPWDPNDQIKPDDLQEGERYRDFPDIYSKKRFSRCGPGEFHPERLGLAVTSGQEHQIDLGRLLKAVHRFGVALENEQPSGAEWKLPNSEVQDTAKKRVASKPIVVRCFNAWNDINLLTHTADKYDSISQTQLYRVQFYDFVTGEVAKGHPVIITYTAPADGCNPWYLGQDGFERMNPNSNNRYIKKTFVVTGRGNPKQHQSLQFLTPNGQFETYNSLGVIRDPIHGELARAAHLRETESLFKGEPFLGGPQGEWDAGLPSSHYFIRKNISNAETWRKFLNGYFEGYVPKYEVYSLGFE